LTSVDLQLQMFQNTRPFSAYMSAMLRPSAPVHIQVQK